MNVLFVCTGNVCRSPMAEGFLKRESSERGLGLGVRSTGTHAWEGRAATIDGRRVMRELDTPIDDHRTLVFGEAVVEWADLVIGLAAEHARDVVRAFPQAATKTFTLKGLVGLLPQLPPFTDAGSWIAAAAAIRDADTAPRHIDETDVHDPLGEREEAYRRVAREIRVLVAELAAGMHDRGVRGAA